MIADEASGPANGSGVAAQEEAPAGRRPLTPAAERALAEAEARRRAATDTAERAKEIGGQAGPDPTRYGDWEKGGIVSDF